MENETEKQEPSLQDQYTQYADRNLPGFLNFPWIKKALGKIMCLDEVLEFIDKHKDLSNFELVNAIIEFAGLSVKYNRIEKIPATGRLLVVANHPLGAADCFLLLQCLNNVRKDIKVVINKDIYYLLKNMRDLIIPVNSYATFNFEAIKQIGDSLEREEAVIIFPAGGISVPTIKGIRDRSWKTGAVSFSKEYRTDVLPVYIGGRSSVVYLACPRRFRRFLVVRDFLHPPKQKISVMIGDLISFKNVLKENDATKISSQLQEIVYQLGEMVKRT